MFNYIKAFSEELQILVEASGRGIRRRFVGERKVRVLHSLYWGVCSEKYNNQNN